MSKNCFAALPIEGTNEVSVHAIEVTERDTGLFVIKALNLQGQSIVNYTSAQMSVFLEQLNLYFLDEIDSELTTVNTSVIALFTNGAMESAKIINAVGADAWAPVDIQ